MKSASYDITFVTYQKLPDGDPDDRLALDLLSKRGYRTQSAVWNDPAVDWSTSGLCVVRSTWDYYLHYDAFISWLSSVAATTRLLNPIELAHWNSNKAVYLPELRQRGVPVIDTVFALPNSDVDLKSVLHERGWQRAVIKPAIGAGTNRVLRITDEPSSISDGQQHLRAILAAVDAMIQPYLSAVERDGEHALVFFDGVYSHAVSKDGFQKLLPAGHAGEKPIVASPQEIDLATKVMTQLQPAPLYARVDLIPDNEGELKLLELELLEPSLFLAMAEHDAPTAFANAIEKRLDV